MNNVYGFNETRRDEEMTKTGEERAGEEDRRIKEAEADRSVNMSSSNSTSDFVLSLLVLADTSSFQ